MPVLTGDGDGAGPLTSPFKDSATEVREWAETLEARIAEKERRIAALARGLRQTERQIAALRGGPAVWPTVLAATVAALAGFLLPHLGR